MNTKTVDKAQIKLQIEKLRELAGNTHTLFNEKGVKEYADAFPGFTPRLMKYKAEPNNPKGLTLNNGAKEAIGLASWDLAYQICSHYDCKAESALGRGTQQRLYCNAVIKHLEAQLA
jgi:hypothetical protein